MSVNVSWLCDGAAIYCGWWWRDQNLTLAFNHERPRNLREAGDVLVGRGNDPTANRTLRLWSHRLALGDSTADADLSAVEIGIACPDRMGLEMPKIVLRRFRGPIVESSTDCADIVVTK